MRTAVSLVAASNQGVLHKILHQSPAAQAAYFGKFVCVIDPCPRPGGIAVTTAGIPTKTVREGAVYLSGLGQSALARFGTPTQ